MLHLAKKATKLWQFDLELFSTEILPGGGYLNCEIRGCRGKKYKLQLTFYPFYV